MGNKKDVRMRHYASLITCPNEVKAFYGLMPDAFMHNIREEEYRQINRVKLVEQVALVRTAKYTRRTAAPELLAAAA